MIDGAEQRVAAVYRCGQYEATGDIQVRAK